MVIGSTISHYQIVEKLGAETHLGDPKTFVFFRELTFSDAAYQGVTSAIVAARTARQLEDSLGALGVTITGADEQRIDAVASPGCATVSFSGWKNPLRFGPHRHSWVCQRNC